MMEKDPLEYSLLNILSSKHYPQVLRVTRPFYVKGREYLKQGQYITLLDRRKIELITGVDQEGKPFKVRNDRSVQVEIIEEERIIYTLNVLVDAIEHIKAIEFGKEIRLEKQTFKVGERFRIEKVGKTFRGRTKNISLRREIDNRVYRFPLDIIGHYKILSGNTILPFSRILSLRTLPLTVRFINTPTSSNFPPGTVRIENSTLCDIVYVLTVTHGTYTYEAFSVESNIYVEKCNLTIPKPIVEIIPNGMYINSSEYLHPIKSHYKKKMKEIDTRLTEDIFSSGYYGSATLEKSPSDDLHLISKQRNLSSTQSLDENSNVFLHATPSKSCPNTPLIESGDRPEPLPRYSKITNYRNHLSFPSINESINEHENISTFKPVDFYRKPKNKTDENVLEKNIPKSTSVPYDLTNSFSKRSSTSSIRSFASNESTSSKLFYSPDDSPKTKMKLPSPNSETHLFALYEPPSGPAVPHRHSRSSSIATEDSGDSGVVLSFNNNTATTNEQSQIPMYATVNKFRKGNASQEQQIHQLPSQQRQQPPAQQQLLSPQPQQQPLPKEKTLSKEQRPPQQRPLQQQRQLRKESEQSKNQQIVYENIRTVKLNLHTTHSSVGKPVENEYDDVKEILYPDTFYENLNSPKGKLNQVSENDKTILQVQTKAYPSFIYEPGKTTEFKKRTEEVATMNQGQVSLLLSQLNLKRYVGIFNRELINGNLLRELTEETLVRDLKMSLFEARKLHKYTHGWRPLVKDSTEHDSAIKKFTPVSWSVQHLHKELCDINLSQLGQFCIEHLVDGALLKNLIEDNIIPSLKLQHGIPLSGIEMSRLNALILKEWKPDQTLQSRTKSIQSLIKNDDLLGQDKMYTKSTGDISAKVTNMPVTDKKEKKYKPLWTKIML